MTNSMQKTTKTTKKDHLTLSTDIDDKRILQSDSMKRTTDQTQPKEAVSHATFS